MRFISKRKELRIVIRPTEVILDESRRPRVMKGEKVEFKGGTFVTEDRGLIDYLLHHHLYGLQFTSEIGGDPVEIEKHSMVFDDGADLSGPKIVAGFPEMNRSKPVEMIRGATSTQNKGVIPTSGPVVKKTDKVEKSNTITSEEVNALIDSKLDAFLDKIGSLVIQPKIKHSTKQFHCPICGEQFANGFLIGKHKKEKHSETIK
jgi:hypothetical protein